MKQIIRDLRKGKSRRCYYQGIDCILVPLKEKDRLGVGDWIVCALGIRRITELNQVNYLYRYKINDKWVGRSKIYAKLKVRNSSMPFIDLEFLVGQDIFITCLPEVSDFTSRASYKVIVCGGGKRAELPLSCHPAKLQEVVGLLKNYINPYHIESKQTVIGWNVKGLFSYVLAVTGKKFDLGARICDLKVMEGFAGLGDKPCPQTYKEALSRLASLAAEPYWDKLQEHYKRVDYPLISEVLPGIESTPLVHTVLRKKLYAHYEIEGQVNGRLKCSNLFNNSYNPHTLSEDVKDKLAIPTTEIVDFIYLDFKHMEVSVLQWLSQDPYLGQILDSGRDLYEGIWEYLTNIKCTDALRDKCKSIFLPVVYGQGSAALAGRLKIPDKTAIKFVDRIYKAFPKALDWIRNQQVDKNCFAEDFFGKRRQFANQDDHRVRNFAIQAPAATVCLHKLVKLHEAADKARVLFHIHDGYGLVSNRKDTARRVKELVSVLEAEEDYYPGLRLKVSYSVGPKLNKMKKGG